MKTLKYLVSIAVIIFMGLYIFLASNMRVHSDAITPEVRHHEEVLVLVANLNGYYSEIRRALKRLASSTNSPLDISKVVFLSSNDPLCQKDKKMCMFDSEGGGIKILDQNIYTKVNDGFPIVFTLGNRVLNMDTDKSDLVMILPHPNLEICQAIEEAIDNERAIPTVDHSPNLVPHPIEPTTEIVTLSKPMGCVKSPEGLFAYWTLSAR